MNVIYKYKITSNDNFEIEIPVRSKFLDIQIQDGYIVVWYLIDKNIIQTEIKQFKILMTGEQFRNLNMNYLKTLQTPHGLVYHIFEMKNGVIYV